MLPKRPVFISEACGGRRRYAKWRVCVCAQCW